jgi:hypothetical protein
VPLRRRSGPGGPAEAAYLATFGRRPSRRESGAFEKKLAAGEPLEHLIAELRSSPEAFDEAISAAATASVERLESQLQFAERLPERIVFLHLMRSAGTTLSDVLSRWAAPGRSRVHMFVDDLVFMPRPILRQMDVIAGHIPFEAVELIPGRFSTVCVIRDPYARTLSHWAELRKSESTFADLSLDRFVTDDLFDVPSGNYQARQLAHRIGINQAWQTYSPRDQVAARHGDPNQQRILQVLFDSTPVALDDEALRQASLKVLSGLDFVGVTDRLEELVQALARHVGVEADRIPRLNASAPFDRDDIPESIRRRIDERTGVDRELYDAARRRVNG